MTDILELARNAGFEQAQDCRSGVLIGESRDFLKLESLLREKFIAELGEPRAYIAIDQHEGAYYLGLEQDSDYVCEPLYALPKDKDELK